MVSIRSRKKRVYAKHGKRLVEDKHWRANNVIVRYPVRVLPSGEMMSFSIMTYYPNGVP